MDLRKSNSYVSCIKIRGVPIIPPLMTDDIRSEMRYYKGLALAVQKRLTWLESSAPFSADALTQQVLTGDDVLSRAADSLDGNADGETDYPDETGPCGSESPDMTTGSVDLTPGSADVTENTNIGSPRQSGEQSLERSAWKIEKQRSVQHSEKIVAQHSEKIEAQRTTQQSEEIEPQHRGQRCEERTEAQHSTQQSAEEAQGCAQQNEEKIKGQRGAQQNEEKIKGQRGAQQNEEKIKGQRGAQQNEENIKGQRGAQQSSETIEAQRRTHRSGERMQVQCGMQQSAEKIEGQGSAQPNEEKIEAQCSEHRSEENIDAQRRMLQNAAKIEARHSRQRSEEETEAQRGTQQSEENIDAQRGMLRNAAKIEGQRSEQQNEEETEAQRGTQQWKMAEARHTAQRIETIELPRAMEQSEKMETEARRTVQQTEKMEAELGGQEAANKTEAQHSAQQIPEQSAPEFRRAQVPKSLNIVPIMLEATPSCWLDPRPVQDSATLTSTTESDKSTPKLVRQGSYVLETPSPMLLARMRQAGEESPVEYAPTSRNAPRRRAWNISEARTSWELQDKDTSTGNWKQTGTTTNKRRVVGSADCIRSMVDRESRKCPGKPTENPRQYGRRNVTRNDTSILAMANKLGGSLGNLGRRPTGNRDSRSSDDVVASSRDNFRTGKLLASVTTDKILDVFEHIRGAHERQMSQLLTRQRREQRDMQREFETQTKILVSQIERTFPGVRLPKMTTRIAESSTSPETDKNEPEEVLTLGRDHKVNGFGPKDDLERCPLNGILPFQETPNRGLVVDDLDDAQRRNDRRASRRLFPVNNDKIIAYGERHVKAATVINAYARGYLVRRIMRTERVLALRTTYVEALRCMLRLHVDAPLALPELNFHQRLQLQCDAASMNIVELFAQEPAQRVKILKQDREVKRAHRQERPNSARSCYSFATQRTLARKKLKEMGDFQTHRDGRTVVARSRCQTWTSNAREKHSSSVINQGIKRSTSAGAVRKPWR